MPGDDSPPDSVTCPICGHKSPDGSTKCENCYSSLNATPGAEAPQEDKALIELRQVPGVGEAKAEVLLQAGYHSIKDLQNASVEDLSTVKGIGEKLATKIIQGAKELGGEASSPLASWLQGEDDGLSEWLSGDDRQQPEATVANHEAPRDDSLAKWLAGEEEDVNVWLEEARVS